MVSISSICDGSVATERLGSDAFPAGAGLSCFIGRGILTESDGSVKVISYESFMELFDTAEIFKVNRIAVTKFGEIFRLACVLPDGSCAETPLYSEAEARRLLLSKSARLKPAIWMGHGILVSRGSLNLAEASSPGRVFCPENAVQAGDRGYEAQI